MSGSVLINDDFYEKVKAHATIERRTVTSQLEFWAMLGKAALDNPELPIEFVRDLLIARADVITQGYTKVAQ